MKVDSAFEALRDRRALTAALIIGTALCATTAWSAYPYWLLERSVRTSAGWHLDDLRIITDYLSSPLSKKDYAKLSARSDAVIETLERYGVSNRPDEYVGLLDTELLESACSSPNRGSAPWLNALCEWKTLVNSWRKPLDCGDFKDAGARAECRRTNDSKFSAESNAHCSKADCLIDNAVFESEVKRIRACENLARPLVANCLSILESYQKFAADPTSFEKPEIENALLGKTDDAGWIAARKAVLENPNSPSDECRSFTGEKLQDCETKTKALFSYVQLRGLKNRLKAISEAVKTYENAHETP